MRGMPTEQRFRHLHRVTYAECTVGNHVYYARYLDLLEMARGEFFRSLGRTFSDLQQEDLIFPVVESHLFYKSAARYDDELIIETWISELAGVRLSFAYEILRIDTLILEASTRHVCTSTKEKPKRLPDFLVTQLRPYAAPIPAADDASG